jgi:hypothetical protein
MPSAMAIPPTRYRIEDIVKDYIIGGFFKEM